MTAPRFGALAVDAAMVDSKEPFRKPFHGGQRGIVVFRTFNEGEEVVKPSGKTEMRQWTVDPRDGQPRGFAFVWNRFTIPDLPVPMLACVMVTVPANELIRRTIKPLEDDPRMPAILEDAAWGAAVVNRCRRDTAHGARCHGTHQPAPAEGAPRQLTRAN
jgi:putative SOS response-associated peptidase YedK